MKKRILLFTAFVGMLYVTLSSNNAGPALTSMINGNRTGAVGSGTCSDLANGCHSTVSQTIGSFSKIVDKTNGWDVTSGSGYIEGHTYTVTLNAVNTGLSNFGFQACVLWDADQKPAPIPIATSPLTAVRPTKATGSNDTIYVLEHKNKMSGPGGNFNVNFDWAAPSLGTNKGAVKFWGIANAVNGNAIADPGDQISSTFTKVFANVTSVSELSADTKVTVYPNPLKDVLNIKMEKAPTGKYNVIAYDMTGRKMLSEVYNYDPAVPFTYNTSDWAQGLYHVQLEKDGMKYTVALIKY